jgi:ADP-ribosylglycohydrolase
MSAMTSGLPEDHTLRLARARCSLDGLSIGDAFGERYFGAPDKVRPAIAERAIRPPPWRYTDDTEMAIVLLEVLTHVGRVDQDLLATRFAHRWANDKDRGYGPGAQQLLHAICLGGSWREETRALFHGTGSFGNGGAMRVAPLGAYFAFDPVETVVEQARASAEVTHAHPEGQAGAIAVALATAHVVRASRAVTPRSLMDAVLAHTPQGETHDGIAKAAELSHDLPVTYAAEVLGSGSRVSAMDTVPFTLWCATRHLDDFERAMWTTVEGLGDRDTTCAIVGGIVALAAPHTIPQAWLAARDPITVSR